MRTRTAHLTRPLAFAAVSALALTACGGGDELGERVAEEAIEQQLEQEGQNGDVDIDIDDGDVNIQTPDGEINVDEDGGNIDIEGSGGDVNIDFDEGGGVDLPEGFPDDVPLPEGISIDSAASLDAPEGATYVINGKVDGEFADVGQAYVDALTAAGFTSQMTTNSTDGVLFVFGNDSWSITGGVYADTSGGTGSVANVTVTPYNP